MSTSTEISRVRSTQEVFEHHLHAFSQGLDALVSDYTEQSCIVLQNGSLHGISAIRQFFEGFLQGLPPGFWQAFEIQRQDVHADVAYLVWSAKPFVALATDTLLVRDGRIQVQTFTSLAS